MKKIYLILFAAFLTTSISIQENKAAPRQAVPNRNDIRVIRSVPSNVNINRCQPVAEREADKMSPSVTLKIYGSSSGEASHLVSTYGLNPLHWGYLAQDMPGVDGSNRQAVNEAIRARHNIAHALVTVKACDVQTNLDRIVVEANLLPSAYNNCDCPAELMMHIIRSLDPQVELTWPTPLSRSGQGQCNYRGEINHQSLVDLHGFMRDAEATEASMFFVVGIGNDLNIHPRTQIKWVMAEPSPGEREENPQACLSTSIATHSLKPYFD